MKNIEINATYQTSCGTKVIVEDVCEKYGTVRFTNGWVIATSLFWEHYSVFNPVSDCEIKKWIASIYELMNSGDQNGLWVGNISDKVALRLEGLNLVELDRVTTWGVDGDVDSVDLFYVLSDWGLTCAKLFESEN